MKGDRKYAECAPAGFVEWRKRMRFTRQQAAEALGIGQSSIFIYERGERYGRQQVVRIPMVIALAAAALEGNLSPIK